MIPKNTPIVNTRSLACLLDQIELDPLLSPLLSEISLEDVHPWLLDCFISLIPNPILQKGAERLEEWLSPALPLCNCSVDRSYHLVSLYFLLNQKQPKAYKSALFTLFEHRFFQENGIILTSLESVNFSFKTQSKNQFVAARAKCALAGKDQLASLVPTVFHLLKTTAQLLNNTSGNYDELEKNTMIQQKLSKAIQKNPHFFDESLFYEMKKLLLSLGENFKKARCADHLTRLVVSFYFFKAHLGREKLAFSRARPIALRILPTALFLPFGSQKVLGIIIGMVLVEDEKLGKEQVLSAIKNVIQQIEEIKGSYFVQEIPYEKQCFMFSYIEVEKSNKQLFSLKEKKRLREQLSSEIKSRVKTLVPVLFSVPNEEEVIKNIVTLTQELKNPSDLPHVHTSFEKQTSTHLVFNLILLHFSKKRDPSLEKRLSYFFKETKITLEKSTILDDFDEDYVKQANVFKVELPITSELLRIDSSINLLLAREKITHMLTKALGPVRDYNGGLFLKKKEALKKLKKSFKSLNVSELTLLEDFFFNLTPGKSKATLPYKHLTTLFDLILRIDQSLSNDDDDIPYGILHKNDTLFIALKSRDLFLKEKIIQQLHHYNFPSTFTYSFFERCEYQFIGLIYANASLENQTLFTKAVEKGITIRQKAYKNSQILHLSYVNTPFSLDPRLGGEELSRSVINLLFEGLMQIDKNGKPVGALAEAVTLSTDQRKYTFRLRECYWSNGDRVVAEDFLYSWQKILSPNFQTAFAYFFYPIKNAKEVKEGKLPATQLGVKVLDFQHLCVELTLPISYFLHLVSCSFFFPVNRLVDQINPGWATQEGEKFVCNGAFQLKNKCKDDYELVMNPSYWDIEKTRLEKIVITKTTGYLAHYMLEKGEVDWIGYPFNPWEVTLKPKKDAETIDQKDLSKIHWYICNAQDPFFQNPKLRKALAYAINRKEIIEALSLKGSVATSTLPFIHATVFDSRLNKRDQDLAKSLFAEALKELNLKKLPPIVLSITNGMILEKIAKHIQKQWEEVLDFHCEIESQNWQQFFSNITQGNFQIGGITWVPLVNDPLYTLSVFKDSTLPLNFPKWEHVLFKQMLDSTFSSCSMRKECVGLMEKVLIEEMPIIPLIYESQCYFKNPTLKGITHSEMGLVDFRKAFFEDRSESTQEICGKLLN